MRTAFRRICGGLFPVLALVALAGWALPRALWAAAPAELVYGAPYAVDENEAIDPLLGALAKLAQEQGLPAPRLDGALGRAAKDEAERQARQENAPEALPDLRAYLQSYGVSDYQVRGLSLRAPDLAALTAQLSPRLAEWFKEGYVRLGIGLAKREDGLALAVFGVRRLLQLAPLAKRQAPRKALPLDGRLLAPLKKLELSVSAPDGKLSRETVLAVPNGAFSLSLALDQRGVYRVELLGDEGQGPRVLDLFSLEVGVQAAGTALEAPRLPEPKDESAARERTLDFINAQRRLQKLPPLRLSPRLCELEQRAIETPQGALVHRDAQGQSPEERLTGAGLAYLAYGENLGRQRDFTALLQSFLDSPAHRANLVNPQFTDLGLGVRRDTRSGEWTLGQLFLWPDAPRQLRPRGHILPIPPFVYEKIHEQRYAAQVPAIAISRQLTRLAENALRESLKNGVLNLRELRDGLSVKLSQDPTLAVRSVLAQVVTNFDELADFSGFSGVQWRSLGLAALRVEEGGLAVLILLSDGRALE